MIEWYQAIILAVVQGLTEFLPISSSAHLAMAPILLGWPDQGLAFDIAVHVGTLSAVLLFYRQDLQLMAHSWFGSLVGGPPDQNSQLVWFLAAAWLGVWVAECGCLVPRKTRHPSSADADTSIGRSVGPLPHPYASAEVIPALQHNTFAPAWLVGVRLRNGWVSRSGAPQ